MEIKQHKFRYNDFQLDLKKITSEDIANAINLLIIRFPILKENVIWDGAIKGYFWANDKIGVIIMKNKIRINFRGNANIKDFIQNDGIANAIKFLKNFAIQKQELPTTDKSDKYQQQTCRHCGCESFTYTESWFFCSKCGEIHNVIPLNEQKKYKFRFYARKESPELALSEQLADENKAESGESVITQLTEEKLFYITLLSNLSRELVDERIITPSQRVEIQNYLLSKTKINTLT